MGTVSATQTDFSPCFQLAILGKTRLGRSFLTFQSRQLLAQHASGKARPSLSSCGIVQQLLKILFFPSFL